MPARRLIIMILAAAAIFAADDPGGWSKARWGMTDDQILAALPGQAVRRAQPETVNGARVWIPSLSVADTDFQVYLCPGAGAAGLARVIFLPTEQADQTDALFQRLELLLVQKYGRPWKSSEGTTLTEVQWVFPSTVITLRNSKIIPPPSLRMPGLQFVGITYAVKSPDLDKL